MNYSNNSIVNITNIGSHDSALLCITDNPSCCYRFNYYNNTYYNISRIGEWYFPDKSKVPIENYGGDFYRNRGDRVVRLNRRNNAITPVGEYCCEVPDASGINQSVCVNVTLFGIETGEPESEINN